VTALIDAPDGAVRRVLARTDIWTRTARAVGGRADVVGEQPGDRAPLRTGDLIRLRPDRADRGRLSRLIPQRSLILSTTIIDGLPRFELLAGPPSFFRMTVSTAVTGAGTLVTVDCQWAMRPEPLTPLYRRRILAAGQLLLGIVRLAAAERQVVVAGAIIQDGRVLAGRRSQPPELAGKWELPGGKVQPGEADQVALARELLEELGVAVAVGDRIGPEVVPGANLVLRCYRAHLGQAPPRSTEHGEIRWLGAQDLYSVNWLAADYELLGHVRQLLRSP
jgi:8-oxo-dGTP diphosphatase